MESILPYSYVIKENEDVDSTVARYNSYDSDILLHEAYCVSPGCNCIEAVLSFIELFDDGKAGKTLFMIKLDMNTWKVTEKKVYNKNVESDNLIEEFMENIEEIQEKLISHYLKAKKYGRDHYLDYVANHVVDKVIAGKMVAYHEIFGNTGADNCTFKVDDKDEYFIDDHYCTSPKCDCKEIGISFYNHSTDEKIIEAEFTLLFNIETYKYDIESRKCDIEKVSKIIEYILSNKPDIFEILKTRFKAMKAASIKIINKYGSKKMQQVRTEEKIGRNEDCPCGSGKKFKKCCGG